MLVSELVKHFSAWEEVPIDVDEHVLPYVKREGLEIYFWPMDIDTNALRGDITHWSYPTSPDGPSQEVVDIHFAQSLSLPWQRLVCCKELVHLCDPIDRRVMTVAGLNQLIEKIVLPPEMQDGADGATVWSDRIAIIHALAILFPWSCRELFLGPYQENLITIEEIADMVDIPVEYAAVVMDDFWPEFHHSITS